MPVYYTRAEKLQKALTKGIIVDEQDMWMLEEYTWHINGDGYVLTNLPRDETGKRGYICLHHAIMGFPIYEDEEIDHRDRRRHNNSRSNLRYVSRHTQMQNHGNVLRATHICARSDGTYCVQITRNGMKYYKGGFTDIDEAVAERDEWLHQHKEYVS